MSRQEITSQHVAELSAADRSGYWWYAVRQAHLEGHLRAAARDGPLDFLDLGCGAGGTLEAVIAALAPRHALGLDGTQEAVDIAVSRGLDARYQDFRQPFALPFAPNVASCLDVLEHLEDPVLALRSLSDVAAPGARLIVTVPAMPSLHSAWDDVCGHHRRYTRTLLIEHLEQGGWEPERARHVFSYCVPPAWWQRCVRKRVQAVEFPPVSPLMNRLLSWTGYVERALGSPFPFGTSLLARARNTR